MYYDSGAEVVMSTNHVHVIENSKTLVEFRDIQNRTAPIKTHKSNKTKLKIAKNCI